MMNIPKKHALVIILAPYVWILFALVLFVWGPPLYASAEYWIPEVYAIKDRYAQTLDSPKIIVLAGSNALLGLYSPLLAEKTARPVLNLGVHSVLPLPYLRSLLERYARPGDILVLPLEYEYYTRDEQWATAWICSQFSTWARADISCFTWTERGRLLYHILPGYPARLRMFAKRIPLRPAEEVIRLATQNAAILSDMPYHAEGATPQGEFLVDEDTAPAVRELAARGFSYLGGAPLSDYAARNLEALEEYARQSDLTLFFTYPVSIRNPLYDLTREEDRRRLALLTTSVAPPGGEWIGEPEFFNLDIRYFFDTHYHLNAEGSLLRTLYLADALNVRLRGESGPWLTMGKDGYEAARRQEARALLERIRTQDAEGRGSPQAY